MFFLTDHVLNFNLRVSSSPVRLLECLAAAID